MHPRLVTDVKCCEASNDQNDSYCITPIQATKNSYDDLRSELVMYDFQYHKMEGYTHPTHDFEQQQDDLPSIDIATSLTFPLVRPKEETTQDNGGEKVFAGTVVPDFHNFLSDESVEMVLACIIQPSCLSQVDKPRSHIVYPFSNECLLSGGVAVCITGQGDGENGKGE